MTACFKVQCPNVAGMVEKMLELIVRTDASSATVISALSLLVLLAIFAETVVMLKAGNQSFHDCSKPD